MIKCKKERRQTERWEEKILRGHMREDGKREGERYGNENKIIKMRHFFSNTL